MVNSSINFLIVLGLLVYGIVGCDEQSMKKKPLGLSNDGFTSGFVDLTNQQPIKASSYKKDRYNKQHMTNDIYQIEPVSCHNDVVASLFAHNISNKQVKVCGVVTELLADQLDSQGDTYQIFNIRLDGEDPEFLVTVRHSGDQVERIATLRPQDTVMIYGVYEYDSKGGYIHTTHHDLTNQYHCGWIEHNGIRYQ